MCRKILLGFFLMAGHASLAQDSALYAHSRICMNIYEKIKKTKKKIKKEKIIKETGAGEAQVIYSPTYILLQTSKGADTIFLSAINDSFRGLSRKAVYIYYNNDSEMMELSFYDKAGVKKCKKKIIKFTKKKKEKKKKKKIFLKKKGGHYKRKTLEKIGMGTLYYGIL